MHALPVLISFNLEALSRNLGVVQVSGGSIGAGNSLAEQRRSTVGSALGGVL